MHKTRLSQQIWTDMSLRLIPCPQATQEEFYEVREVPKLGKTKWNGFFGRRLVVWNLPGLVVFFCCSFLPQVAIVRSNSVCACSEMVVVVKAEVRFWSGSDKPRRYIQQLADRTETEVMESYLKDGMFFFWATALFVCGSYRKSLNSVVAPCPSFLPRTN